MPFASNGRVRIYWEEEGEGEPLLLVMGLSFSLALWGELRRILARQYRVILFDNRCVGKTDMTFVPFSMSDMAHDAVTVLDAAGVESAHVFGMSMGGMIAQELAIEYPERVRKLILGCTHYAGLKAVVTHQQVFRLLRFPFLSHERRLREFSPLIYDSETPHERIQKDLDLILANMPTLAGYAAQLSVIMKWHSFERLPQIKAETLVLHGANDRLLPPATAKTLADRIPGARLVLIPQAGHIFPTDQPERTEEEVLGFLAAPAAISYQ